MNKTNGRAAPHRSPAWGCTKTPNSNQKTHQNIQASGFSGRRQRRQPVNSLSQSLCMPAVWEHHESRHIEKLVQVLRTGPYFRIRRPLFFREGPSGFRRWETNCLQHVFRYHFLFTFACVYQHPSFMRFLGCLLLVVSKSMV